MKKRACMAVLAMCMAFAAAGCGNSSEAKESSAETKTEQETEVKEEETEAEKTDTSDTRLVSVDNVDKYITIGEYKGMVLDNTVEEVTDEAVETRVKQNMEDAMEEVTGKGETVQTGDNVTINFVGTVDDVAFEGGTGNNYDLTIGSGLTVPGFEDGIIGMKKGDTKDVPVTFPEDYSQTDLAGKDAVFKITLQSFRRAPELTDEWVTENTDFADTAAYRADVRVQLEEAAKLQAENSLRSTAWTTVYTLSEVKEYPQTDVDEAVATLKRQTQSYADQGEMELEDFVESQGISMEDFEEQCKQYAQAKVKQNLLIQGIMDAEGITLADAECLAIQDQLVQEYGAGDLAGLIDTYGQAAVDESIGLMRVQDFIIANANIEQGSAAQEEETAAAEETAEIEEAEAQPEETEAPAESE